MAGESDDDVAEDDEEINNMADVDFGELLGPDCVIKRVDKERNVIGGSNPKEMQRELLTKADAQKRLGACAEHVKDFTRTEKLEWAVNLKDRGNESYFANRFDEAAKLYNDCLVALDLDGTPEEIREVQEKLQLPVCTNLAACMVEMGHNSGVINICDIAISIDPKCAKALYRRGLAQYRMGFHSTAKPDFEAALKVVREQTDVTSETEADPDSQKRADLEKRIIIYLNYIRTFGAQEKQACKRMFEKEKDAIYADRPDLPTPEQIIDDSDDALDEAIARARGDWTLCCRRRRSRETKEE